MFEMNYVFLPEVANRMEKDHLAPENAIMAIRLSESSGRKFYNRKTEVYSTCYSPDNVTYWVHYKIEGDSCSILKLYWHRMKVGRLVRI